MPDLNKRILVADDEELIRDVISYKIQRHLGYQVLEAEDGVEALKTLEANNIDLLITDIRMPKMDGMALLEEIKAKGWSLPVIILTGYGQIEDAIKAIKLGAEAFMKKPFDTDEVITLVESIISGFEEREDAQAVMPFVRSQSTTIKIPNNYTYLRKIVNYVICVTRSTWELAKEDLNDLKVATYEALLNAFEHGNLRIEKKKKADFLQKGHLEYQRYLLEQIQIEENQRKSITVVLNLDTVRVEVRVLDEGSGFDHHLVYQDYDVLDAETFMRAYGRGLYLIKSLMDEVTFNELGNAISFVKFRPRKSFESSE